MKYRVFFDFDSTLVINEGLNDTLAKKITDKKTIDQINNICNDALNGVISFYESITRRFYMASLSENDFNDVGRECVNYITKDIKQVIEYLKSKNIEINILSAGFKTLIIPSAKVLGIDSNNVFANAFHNENGKLILDDSVLLHGDGKTKFLTQTKKPNDCIIMIGDGYSDLKTYLDKVSDYFIGCGISVIREKVEKESPVMCYSSKEMLEQLKKIIR